MQKEVIPSISYTLPTGTDTFIVTITISDNPLYFNEIYTATADKSVADIYAAYEAGKDVYASILGAYMPFVVGNSGRAEFTHYQHDNDIAVMFGLYGLADVDLNAEEWTFRVTRSSFEIAGSGGGGTTYDNMTQAEASAGTSTP